MLNLFLRKRLLIIKKLLENLEDRINLSELPSEQLMEFYAEQNRVLDMYRAMVVKRVKKAK